MNQKLYDENPSLGISAQDIEHIMWYIGVLRHEWRSAQTRAMIAEDRVKILTERNIKAGQLLALTFQALDIETQTNFKWRDEVKRALANSNSLCGYGLAERDFLSTMTKFSSINPSDVDVYMSVWDLFSSDEHKYLYELIHAEDDKAKKGENKK